jgi:hypothetical protein
MPSKEQIQTALKDINTVDQNCYGIYCFINNGNKKVETDDTLFILNTVPDSIKVIKQVLQERLESL